MSAFLIVRARVVDASAKDAFDRWYEDEHLPDARETFGARRAWRGRSDVDAGVHYAVYGLDDLAGARSIQGSDGQRRLVAQFDRTWGERVARSRDTVVGDAHIGKAEIFRCPGRSGHDRHDCAGGRPSIRGGRASAETFPRNDFKFGP